MLSLVKMGYGSYKEIMELDTPEFYDILEFELISGSIEEFKLEQIKRKK